MIRNSSELHSKALAKRVRAKGLRPYTSKEHRCTEIAKSRSLWPEVEPDLSYSPFENHIWCVLREDKIDPPIDMQCPPNTAAQKCELATSGVVSSRAFPVDEGGRSQ